MKTLNNQAESFSYISPDFQVIEIQSEGVCLSASLTGGGTNEDLPIDDDYAF